MRIKIKDSIHLKKTQKDWLEFFQYNFVLEPNFSLDQPLTLEEKNIIAKSIQAFQKGESSEGRHLLKCVDQYVMQTGNEEYRKIMSYFINEENQHSMYLKFFSDIHSIGNENDIWLDKVFRKLRSFNGLKGEIITLLTAEIVALTFYQALNKCVSSPSLKEICGKLLYDEAAHIVYQSRHLSTMACTRVDDLYRKFLLFGTGIVTWFYCRPVFEKSGYSLSLFMKEISDHLDGSIEITHRRDYEIH